MSIIKKAGPKGAGFFNDGGEGGIRTHGTLASTPHFECGAFDHSATSPSRFPGSSGHPHKATCARPIRAAVHPKRNAGAVEGRFSTHMYGQSQAFFAASQAFFRGKRGFFPPVPGQHCGKPKATTLNFYR